MKVWGWLFVFSLAMGHAVMAQQPQRPPRRPPRESIPLPGPPKTSALLTIRGKVYYPDGRPVDRRIRVTLRLTRGGVVRDVYTDSAGNFVFRVPPNDDYELVVWESDEYETTVVPVFFGGASFVVFRMIVLRPKKVQNVGQPRPGVISVAELDRDVPRTARRAYRRGLKAFKKKRYQQAITYLQQAIERYENYFQAHQQLGLTYLMLKQWADAEESFQKAIEIAPRIFHPHLSLGYVQIQQGAYGRAVETLKRAVTLDPSDWRGHLWLGVSLVKANQNEALAEQELEKALRLSHPPQATMARLYLANIYIRRGQLERAVAQAEAYLKEAPNAENAEQVRQHLQQLKARVAERSPH